MVKISDHVLPISKADMWSLWVGRCMHTLVNCIAQPNGNPSWGQYLAKFRSHGTWGILKGMRWMEWMASHLNLFELHHLQLEMESGLLFFFSLLFF